VPVAVGETFERYTIESLIGRGGMGEVYRAVDTRLRRKVALKVLRPERDNPDAVARLFREARSAAVLAHPNTVAIHDIGEAEGIFYIVMELVTGKSLLAYVSDDRVPAARKLSWLVDVARALGAAHKTGVIHRDVKPSNVMVSDDGVVKVLDFGLAKPLAPVSFRTQQGHVLGTPRYMAPEHLAGAEIDARTDQYAYGLTAYELVAGKHPGGVLAGPVDVPALDALVPGVSRGVAQVIARAMATKPGDRFASMDELAVALEDAMAGKPPRGTAATATAAAAGDDSEITALEGPATEGPIADTVRFGGVPGAPPGAVEAVEAVETERAGGGGADVGVLLEERDPGADRATLTARTTAGATLQMAEAPPEIAAALAAAAPAPKPPPRPLGERTLLSADASVAAAPVAKTLLAAGSVTPAMEAAQDSALRKANAKVDAKDDVDAKANANANANAKPEEEAPLSRLPAGVPPKRSGARLLGGIALLGACAFGGAYYGSKQLARSDAPAPASGVADAAVSASAHGAASAAGSAAPAVTLSGPTPSASVPITTSTAVPLVKRPTRPTAVPPTTSAPLATTNR
jgi:hypothetical protein